MRGQDARFPILPATAHSVSHAHLVSMPAGGRTGKPWPQTLPPFKGVAIITCDDDDFGHGLDIRKQFYSDWEAHPDPTNYPNLYRAKVKILFESKPADAADYFKADVGKHVVVERVFQVDRQRKVLLVIGTNAVQD